MSCQECKLYSRIRTLWGHLTPPKGSLPILFPHLWSAWLPILLPPVSPDGRHLSASWLLQLLTELKPIPEIELPLLQRDACSFYKDEAIWLHCLLSSLVIVLIWPHFFPVCPHRELIIGLTCITLPCWSPSHLNSSFLNLIINIPLFSTLGHYYDLGQVN